MSRICPQCGKELDNGARFCGDCGLTLDSAPIVDHSAVQTSAIPSAPRSQGSLPKPETAVPLQQQQPVPEKNNKFLGLGIGVSIGAVLAILAILAMIAAVIVTVVLLIPKGS